jgi:hypothetical protein
VRLAPDFHPVLESGQFLGSIAADFRYVRHLHDIDSIEAASAKRQRMIQIHAADTSDAGTHRRWQAVFGRDNSKTQFS